jgi:hypothetical protein
MSVHLGFHNVARVSISEDRVFNTDLQFSARTVTLEFTDGSEYRFISTGILPEFRCGFRNGKP